jgi:hypothetical protein
MLTVREADLFLSILRASRRGRVAVEVSISDTKKAASVDNRAGGPAESGRNPDSGGGC